MNNGDGRTEAQDLDALFPGLTRKPAAGPRPVDGVIRLFDGPQPVDPTHPGHGRSLAFMSTRQFQAANDGAVRKFGGYWADQRRMFWTPILAGAAVRLWELAPGLFPPGLATPSGLLALTTPDDGPLDEVGLMAVAELALAGAPIIRDRVGEGRALAELGLGPAMPVADRVEVLTASGLYRVLGECFAAMAERQGMRTWDKALVSTLAYWRDPRGSAVLEALVRPAPAPARQDREEVRPRLRTTAQDTHRPLLKKLATRLGRAKREAEVARAEAEASRARVQVAEREIAEARRGRNRATERLRTVEGENAELRAALVAVIPAEPARASESARSEASAMRPASAPAPAPPPETVFAGRLVYLYTGVERAAAREAMAGALEHHGAICEVFDGNRGTLLGPVHFPTEALVIIETGGD